MVEVTNRRTNNQELSSLASSKCFALPAPSDKPQRIQPWKAFADPSAAAFKDKISRAPDQKLFNVGDAALTQYAAENK